MTVTISELAKGTLREASKAATRERKEVKAKVRQKGLQKHRMEKPFVSGITTRNRDVHQRSAATLMFAHFVSAKPIRLFSALESQKGQTLLARTLDYPMDRQEIF